VPLDEQRNEVSDWPTLVTGVLFMDEP